MPEPLPAYLRIAAELRQQIQDGHLVEGASLPTEAALVAQYGVSTTAVKNAIGVLKTEGLVEGRRGSGVYVRAVRLITRVTRDRYQRREAGELTSPFAHDAARSGQAGEWEHQSEHTIADEAVAARLRIEVGDAVMQTRYRFLVGGQPIQMSTSWEPLALTAGTPVEWPEDGAAVGVVARMDSIGLRCTGGIERITSRAARHEELTALDLPARGYTVFVIKRTHLVGDTAVETADIVLPGDRYEIVNTFTID